MLLRELWFEQVCNVLSINKQIRDTCWQVLIYLSRTEVSCDFFFVIYYFALTVSFSREIKDEGLCLRIECLVIKLRELHGKT